MKKAYMIPYVRVVDMEPQTSILEYSSDKTDGTVGEGGGVTDTGNPGDGGDVPGGNDTRKKLWGGAGSRSTFGNSLWS